MNKILLALAIVFRSFMLNAQCVPVNAPWYEDVESHSLGTVNISTCWSQNSIIPIHWAVGTSTPTLNTGPSFANSGLNFFYLESSGGGAGLSADLISPEINIASLTNPTLGFHYHMFGSDMGALSVEVTDDGGQTWQLIWSVSGQQHNSELSGWTEEIMPLINFADTIQIKFTGTDINVGHLGDMALDDIRVFNCTPTFATITATACGNYVSPSGKLFHETGVYFDTIPNTMGCDSLITINLNSNNTHSAYTVNGCSFVMPDGTVLTISGVYTDTITNVAGCDSVIEFNYINLNSSSTLIESACNTYTAPSGMQYSASGIYNDTISNSIGCDSLITIELTILQDTAHTIVVDICEPPFVYVSDAGNSYWNSGIHTEVFNSFNGCDSVLNIDLRLHFNWQDTTILEIAACDSFVSGFGHVYYVSGTYAETHIGVAACGDSTVVYDLTVGSVDPSVSVFLMNAEFTVLMANESSVGYQWINCDNNEIIQGATNQFFTTYQAGNYACIVSTEGCELSSECISVTLSINESAPGFIIYPNPSQGESIIEANGLNEEITIEVMNTLGQIVYSSVTVQAKTNLSLSHLSKGIYSVSLTHSDGKSQQVLVIE